MIKKILKITSLIALLGCIKSEHKEGMYTEIYFPDLMQNNHIVFYDNNSVKYVNDLWPADSSVIFFDKNGKADRPHTDSINDIKMYEEYRAKLTLLNDMGLIHNLEMWRNDECICDTTHIHLGDTLAIYQKLKGLPSNSLITLFTKNDSSGINKIIFSLDKEGIMLYPGITNNIYAHYRSNAASNAQLEGPRLLFIGPGTNDIEQSLMLSQEKTIEIYKKVMNKYKERNP